MNIRSAELLQNALQNAAENAYRNRQLQQSAAERQAYLQMMTNFRQRQLAAALGREQNARFAAQDRALQLEAQNAKLDQANQPKITAQLTDKNSGTSVTFNGTQAQLDNMIAAAKSQGKNLTVSNQKEFAATVNVGGASVSFHNQDDYDKFVTGMQAKGVDVYAPQYGKKASSDNSNSKPSPDTSEFDREVSDTPGKVAGATAASDPDVPKDDTGKPTVPVVVPPVLNQRYGIIAGKLRAAGDPSAVSDASGLTFGTNAIVMPNLTTNAPAGPSSPPTVSTNSFSLTPGGVNQESVANVAALPQGTNFLRSIGIPIPGSDAPSLGDTAVNTNGVPTGRPAIPRAAISWLQQNPSLAPHFDAKYGQGMAAQYLGAASQADTQ